MPDAYLPTPVGLLGLRGSDAGLAAVTFLEKPHPHAPTLVAAVPACLREAHRQLTAYFAGELREFNLTYHFEKGTDFQR